MLLRINCLLISYLISKHGQVDIFRDLISYLISKQVRLHTFKSLLVHNEMYVTCFMCFIP